MSLLNKITNSTLISRLRAGRDSNILVRSVDFNDVVDAVNNLDTRVDDIEDGIYTIDMLQVGDGLVGTPSLAVGTADKGLYELSTNQLGVSVAGGLASLFDVNGLQTDAVIARIALITTAAGVSAITYGDGRNFTTVLAVSGFAVGTLPGAGVDLAIGSRICIFPAGVHYNEISFLNIGLTGDGTANTPDIGLGTAVATGAVATLGGSPTFEDYLTGQTAADITGTATVAGEATSTFNVSTDSKDVYLNVAGAWAADNLNDLVAEGTIVLKWTLLD